MTAAPKAEQGIRANKYVLSDGEVELGVFYELSGINTEVEPVASVETGMGGTTTRFSGRPKPPAITLKRWMNGSLELWDWHEAARQGDVAGSRRSCTLAFYSIDKLLAKYVLKNAWPSKLGVVDKSGASEPLLETVTLTCDQLRRVAL